MEVNDQYVTTKVQAKDFTSGWLVALIIAGTGLTLPILFLGSEIALAIGFKNALLVFCLSTAVLTLLCMLTTIIGNRSRLSTYMILHFSFGRKGAKIMNFIFGITLLGWFSVALELLANAVKDAAFEELNISLAGSPIIIIVGLLITYTTIYGIKSIEKLANYAVPLLTFFLGYVVYKTLTQISVHELINFVPKASTMTVFQATSVLVGSSILFPVLMADFSRYVYNDKQSLISVLGIAIGFPIALLFSAIPSIQTGEVDIIKIMKNSELVIPAFVLLFVSTWVGNASNLYSTVLTFSTIKRGLCFTKMTIITGICGVIIALFGFSKYLFDFLNFLGILSPSISAIYITNFFFIKKQQYNLDEISEWEFPALISWGISSLISILTYLEIIQITHVYFVDSFLIGGLLYMFLKRKELKQ